MDMLFVAAWAAALGCVFVRTRKNSPVNILDYLVVLLAPVVMAISIFRCLVIVAG